MAFVKVLESDGNSNAVRDPGRFIHVSNETTDFVICKSPEKLKLLLESLQPGKQVHYVSDGDWSMNDLTMELLKRYKPAELYITTYALRELAVRQLILAQEHGEILTLKMLVDYRAQIRTPDVYQLAKLNANQIFLTAIHAKVTVIRSAAGCVTIVSSANWTQNPRIEAGVVSLDAGIAAFHIEWIQNLMNDAEIFE